MKNINFTVVLLIITNSLFCQIKSFKGAWFDIKYPASFVAKGSLKSTSSQGYESAIFTSPDRSVEFYIYSPQWNGEASDIILKPNEKLVTTKNQKSGVEEIIWWTISAKDGTYSRSYQEKQNHALNTIYIVGIKYKNQEALTRYKNQYSIFKKSLQQFAD